MADEIQKLDLGDAAEQLKTKIQSAFIDLIPAEQWQAMIQGELTKFTTETRKRSEYNNPDTVTPAVFETMAQGILLEVAREKLKAALESEDFLPDGKTVESIIITWLEANQAHLVEAFLRSVVGNVFIGMMETHAVTTQAIVTAAIVDGKGIPDPDRPGHDKAGNYIGY